MGSHFGAETHPYLPELYRRMVERLEETLEDPPSMEAARELIRRLIDKIVFIPGEGRGQFRLERHGDLAALMAIIGDAESKDRTPVVGSAVSVVAGERNHLCRTVIRWFPNRS